MINQFQFLSLLTFGLVVVWDECLSWSPLCHQFVTKLYFRIQETFNFTKLCPDVFTLASTLTTNNKKILSFDLATFKLFSMFYAFLLVVNLSYFRSISLHPMINHCSACDICLVVGDHHHHHHVSRS